MPILYRLRRRLPMCTIDVGCKLGFEQHHRKLRLQICGVAEALIPNVAPVLQVNGDSAYGKDHIKIQGIIIWGLCRCLTCREHL